MPWALSAYRNTQIAWYTQITAIQGLTRRTSSSHCHPSQRPLWGHLVAVTARLGMPRILLKNVIISVTTWEIIPNATELGLPTKALWSRKLSGLQITPGLLIYVDTLPKSPCFHWNEWKSSHWEIRDQKWMLVWVGNQNKPIILMKYQKHLQRKNGNSMWWRAAKLVLFSLKKKNKKCLKSLWK